MSTLGGKELEGTSKVRSVGLLEVGKILPLTGNYANCRQGRSARQYPGFEEIEMVNAVTSEPTASPEAAAAHFQSEFEFETDCWDTHEALKSGDPGFVLLDVRGPASFAAGHIPGAVNLPHGKIVGSALARWRDDQLFVTYCAGPHCNGAARGALRLARLGCKVKLMVGGITGWLDEGFELISEVQAA